MGVAACTECGELFKFDVVPRRGHVCFKCHVKGVTFGYPYGKEEFHGPTIRERQKEIVSDAEKQGRSIEPVGTRWV
jgi:hypothetical protein